MQYRTAKDIDCFCGCDDCDRISEQIGADEIGNIRINLRTINGRRRFVPYVQSQPVQKTKHLQDSDEKLQQIEIEFFHRILDAMTWG